VRISRSVSFRWRYSILTADIYYYLTERSLMGRLSNFKIQSSVGKYDAQNRWKQVQIIATALGLNKEMPRTFRSGADPSLDWIGPIDMQSINPCVLPLDNLGPNDSDVPSVAVIRFLLTSGCHSRPVFRFPIRVVHDYLSGSGRGLNDGT